MLLHVGSGLGAEGRDTRNDALLGLGLEAELRERVAEGGFAVRHLCLAALAFELEFIEPTELDVRARDLCLGLRRGRSCRRELIDQLLAPVFAQLPTLHH